MTLRILVCGLLVAAVACASDPVAARLAREAHEAQEAGQLVRAYLLYAEAAAREPSNTTYRASRDSLETVAHLLSKADIQKADISADVKSAEKEAKEQRSVEGPPVEFATQAEWQRDPELQPLPRLQPAATPASFHLFGNAEALFREVTATYGIQVIFDPELRPEKDIRFNLDHADFRVAMEALTAVTHTFLYPISESEIVVAEDKESKRNELEPQLLLAFHLPDAVDQKELVEAANAVRSVLSLRTIGWDSESRTVMIRDHVTRARIARSLMEALLLPKAQVSIEVQFMTLDTDKNYNYGASIQNTFELLDFGHIGGFQSMLSNVTATTFLPFGGGATLFGIGLSDATLFATYANSFSENIYDATVVVDSGQTASMHVGDKYPIPQTLYTGASQSAPSIYNPVGQFTVEDLGLILKMTPRIDGDENVSIDVEADFKTLGTQTIDTVPEINEREFKGSIIVRRGQLAILAGMDSENRTRTKTGFPWLSNIPGLGDILSETVRDKQTSRTLVVIKPTITRLPMADYISPQYLLGPERGERVVL